jgi:poly-gamma-glutamate synthesis protein (capsule biosynthesis protein)
VSGSATPPEAARLAPRLAVCFAACLVGCASPPPALTPEPVVSSAELLFIGDVMSHTPQIAAARAAAAEATTVGTVGTAAFDYTDVFRPFRPIFEESDVAVANLETTLRSTPPYTGYPAFAAPAELALAMRRAGIDIVTTANNHICDKGVAGIRSTLALLDSAGIRHTGAFLDSADRAARNPLRFTAGGLRFALLAYTYGTNGIDIPRGMIVKVRDSGIVARDLAVARRDEPDCVIVSYHWGEEYRTAPTARQRELAAWTRSRGADIIVGSHPHVVGPVEAHLDQGGRVVGATWYSLGNFVSNQRRRGTDGGIVAGITLSRTDSLPVDYDLAWRLAWVHSYYRAGVRRYEVLPAAAIGSLLDTLPADDPVRTAARLFTADTRRLLFADSLVIEK